jgi:hypothetical protein
MDAVTFRIKCTCSYPLNWVSTLTCLMSEDGSKNLLLPAQHWFIPSFVSMIKVVKTLFSIDRCFAFYEVTSTNLYALFLSTLLCNLRLSYLPFPSWDCVFAKQVFIKNRNLI